MNTRKLKYEIVENLGHAIVYETTYKGHTIRRKGKVDEYGPVNNHSFYTWKGIRFNKVSVIIELIDQQTK